MVRRKLSRKRDTMPGKVVEADARVLPIYNTDGELIFTGTVHEWRRWVKTRDRNGY